MESNIETTTCVICMEALDGKQYHQLPCGHSFHTDCQIQWFRSGNSSCPTCRSVTISDMQCRHRFRRNQTAFQIMSYRARKKDAPKPLKRAYEKYKCAKEKQRNIASQITTLRNSTGKYSEIDKEIKKLRRRKWSCWRTTNRIHREISNLCEVLTVFR